MEPNPVCPQPAHFRRFCIAASAFAAIGLLVCALFAFQPAAGASEFPPIPKVTSTQKCIDGNYSFAVTIVMANEGASTAHFHLEWGNTKNGGGTAGGQQDFEVTDTPAEATHPVAEGYAATYTVTSSDDPSLNFSLVVPPVDCRADPVASIALICPSTPAEGPLLEYTYQNPSKVPVDFTFVDTFGPDLVEADAKEMASPATADRAVYEDVSGHAEAYADGVLLASFDTLVDCAPPNHVVVSKTVMGGSGNPAFDFEVSCRPDFDHPTVVIDSFTLHDGESKSVDLPPSNSYAYCIAQEADPGAEWTVSESLNGSPVTTSFDEVFFPNDEDYTLDVTNTAVVEPTTTTSTTIPTTTVPATTVPATTTSPEILSTQTAPPQSGPQAPTPVQVSSANLPQTGSDTTTPLFAGLGLLLAGLTVIGATRRSRHRAA